MPCWITYAVNKLCHADLRFSLSRLWFSLSRSCGIAYHWLMALLISATAVMLVVLAGVLMAIILAVLIG
jgi:hypothetical protein